MIYSERCFKEPKRLNELPFSGKKCCNKKVLNATKDMKWLTSCPKGRVPWSNALVMNVLWAIWLDICWFRLVSCNIWFILLSSESKQKENPFVWLKCFTAETRRQSENVFTRVSVECHNQYYKVTGPLKSVLALTASNFKGTSSSVEIVGKLNGPDSFINSYFCNATICNGF